jgi:hypothetical protein
VEKMSRKFVISLFILGIGLTLGCSREFSIPTKGTEGIGTFTVDTVIVEKTQTPLAHTLPPTNAPLSTKVILTATYISTPIPDTTIQSIADIPMCQNGGVPAFVPDELVFPGMLMYQTEPGGQIQTINDPLRIHSSLKKLHYFGSSSEGDWLAFTDTGLYDRGDLIASPPKVILASDSGEVREELIDLSGLQAYVDQYFASRINGWRIVSNRWLENDLALVQISLLTDLQMGSHVQYVYGLLDPFSGKWQDLSSYEIPEWEAHSVPAFSPDLSQVLYVREAANKVALWDFETRTTVWERTDPNNYYQTSEWTRQGTRAGYVLNLPEGLTTVTSQGVEHLLPIPAGPLAYSWLVSFSFSSDGSRLAVNYAFYDPEQNKDMFYLLVFSFDENKYIYQCPVIFEEDSVVVRLVWSPNDRYIATGYSDFEIGFTPAPLYVYDLETGKVYQAAEEGSAVDWIKR